MSLLADRFAPWRGQMAMSDPALGRTFLNHAGISPLPCASVDAATQVLRSRMLAASADYPSWTALTRDVRAKAAALLGAAPGEVAFTGNTSWGLSQVAGGLAWKPGDVVVAGWPDFPSAVHPFESLARRGVRLVRWPRRRGRLLGRDLKRILDDLGGRCRLVTAAWVDWVTGARVDLAEMGRIARRFDALVCVDAIQGLGALPLDVSAVDCDFLAAGCHKWLLGPMGLGLLYVRRGALDRLAPLGAGWKSMADEESFRGEFVLKDDAARLEPGTLDISALAALGASLDLLLSVGVPVVAARIGELTAHLEREAARLGYQSLSPADPQERSGIVSLACGDPPGLWRALLDKGVVCAPRGPGLRVSPHAYSTEADLDRLLAALGEAAAGA